MSRAVQVGVLVEDQFPVFEPDGFTKKSGETAFTASVWKDGVIDLASVTITEIGTSGEYNLQFTPDAVGFWVVQVLIDYNKDIFSGEYTASAETIDTTAGKVDGVSAQVTTLDGKVDVIGADLEVVDGKIDVIDTNLDALIVTVDGIDTKVDNLVVTTDSIESKVDTALVLLTDLGTDTAELLDRVARLLGLTHENIFIDNTGYDPDGQLLAARARIFDSKTNCDGATDGGSETAGLVASYQMATVWGVLNQFSTFKQTKET
jgi:hypothetical protein